MATDVAQRGENHSRRKSIPALAAALLAQLVEQVTLNHRVVGSSPTGGTFCIYRGIS